ncbi:hypothetical protein F5J12DRAFT_207296 [Pisolithus orientalis]|uniref:uncharacterized protein n=1 Tax=Pisolithus orientalis TaxID=936130 RepID=UPI002225866F|nr:uncharacterized protein F5J12DRAFT_207296 [Pisolithus orientalis]KAI6002624.1 hypothetical protein F5J12DRAFT_207296 [Pisolithus orientalis]
MAYNAIASPCRYMPNDDSTMGAATDVDRNPKHEYLDIRGHRNKLTGFPGAVILVNKAFSMKDQHLADALEDWREARTITVYDWANINDLSPSLIVTNPTLDRIPDSMHHHKIRTCRGKRVGSDTDS